MLTGLQTIDWLRLTNRSLAEWALRPQNIKVVIALERIPADDTQNAGLALFADEGCRCNSTGEEPNGSA